MSRWVFVIALLSAGALNVPVASGQVVQLPTIRTFSYSGAVEVPDQGSASLAGNRTASSGFQRRGFNRGVGAGLGGAGAAASASVIDLNAIDRELLGGTPEQFRRRSAQSTEFQQANSTEQGKRLVRFARKSYREGRESTAFEAYRLAVGKLDGRLKQLAIDEFRRVFGGVADQVLRSSVASQ